MIFVAASGYASLIAYRLCQKARRLRNADLWWHERVFMLNGDGLYPTRSCEIRH